MQKYLFIILFIILFFQCKTSSSFKKEGEIAVKIQPNPVSEDEKVINEKGEAVDVTTADPDFFSHPSTDKSEYYRVIIKSDSYSLRQIRGSKSMLRKPDIGGDTLITEELKKYNMIDFTDEGVLKIKINAKSGTIEELKFILRAPRINNLAKIMQNDATRWIFEFKDEEKKITDFNIYYQVQLKNLSNRDEVKEKLKKEVAH